jgi:5'-3' exonuclease
MGILNFYSWIKSNYSEAFNQEWLSMYDNVHIDLNYLLHMCSYNCKNQHDIISRMDSVIETIAITTLPRRTIKLYADGPSPLAKLVLQRKRRLTISRGDRDLNVSSLNFTPGTRFMAELEKKLEYTVKKLASLYNIKVDCYIDSTDEAELKIKNNIMNMQNKHPNQTHIVVTSDADVVVMMSTLKYFENVFILFKTKGFITLNLSKLLDLHTKKYGISKTYNMDFAFVNMLLGNDYIPKVQFLSFDKIWEIYSSNVYLYPSGLCDINLNINRDFLCDILLGVVSKTHRNLIKKSKITDVNNQLYSMYIDGLLWCFDVYTTGKCNRYNYMYEYNTSPDPLLLYLYVSKPTTSLRNSTIKSDPIDKNLYGILLLPKSAKELINKKYHEFIDNNYKLYDEECCKHCVKFHNNLKAINKELLTLKEGESDKEIKCKISSISKEMIIHKKTHNALVLDDIETIVKKFNEII